MEGSNLRLPFDMDMYDYIAYPPAREHLISRPYLNLVENYDPNGFDHTPDAEVEEIMTRVHAPIDDTVLRNRLKNPGFAKFFREQVKDSELFANWILKINRAIMTEAAFGYFIDFETEMREIKRSDPFFCFVITDPMCRYLRERAYENARLLVGRTYAVIVGAGTLPEIRYIPGFTPDRDGRSIYIEAFDENATVNIERVAGDVLSRHGNNVVLDYRRKSLFEVVRDPRYRNEFATVIVNDYMNPKDRMNFRYCLSCAYDMLSPGGNLSFDVKLPHWVWERNLKLFGQVSAGPIDTRMNLLEVCSRTKAILDDLGVSESRFRVMPDNLNVPPIAVRFVIRKPK